MDWSKYFTYNEETGDLIWKERTEETFPDAFFRVKWNARFVGRVAGVRRRVPRTGKPADVQIRVDDRTYQAHRIIWSMTYGDIPDGMEPDHVDTNAWNNKLGNLRLATRSQNCANRCRPSNNTSGFKGVSYKRANKRWSANIRVDGKSRHIGYFASPEEAHEAYKKEAVIVYGAFARFD